MLADLLSSRYPMASVGQGAILTLLDPGSQAESSGEQRFAHSQELRRPAKCLPSCFAAYAVHSAPVVSRLARDCFYLRLLAYPVGITGCPVVNVLFFNEVQEPIDKILIVG